MDSNTVITIIAFLAIIAAAIIWRATKGKRGEKHVSVLLSLLPKSKYKIINNLLLQSGGHSTQIDHVVVSIYGLFVIETKYYQGWIYGGENSEFWTQNIYGHKYELRNPLRQNQGHIKAIQRLLGNDGTIPIHSIVAFSRQSTIKVDSSLPVIYWGQIVPYIRRFKESKLSEDNVNAIYHTLITANVTDRDAIKQHISSVRQNQSRRNTAVANGKCPLCGGNLVPRNGRYGRFYGCSNYPSCKYILK